MARRKKNDPAAEAENVLRELRRLAYFDPRRLVDARGCPLPLSALDEDVAAALAAVEVREVGGEPVTKVKFPDKLRALELLSRHLSMDARQGESENRTGVVVLPEVKETEE